MDSNRDKPVAGPHEQREQDGADLIVRDTRERVRHVPPITPALAKLILSVLVLMGGAGAASADPMADCLKKYGRLSAPVAKNKCDLELKSKEPPKDEKKKEEKKGPMKPRPPKPDGGTEKTPDGGTQTAEAEKPSDAALKEKMDEIAKAANIDPSTADPKTLKMLEALATMAIKSTPPIKREHWPWIVALIVGLIGGVAGGALAGKKGRVKPEKLSAERLLSLLEQVPEGERDAAIDEISGSSTS